MKKILVIQNKRIGDVLIASVIAQNMKTVLHNTLHLTKKSSIFSSSRHSSDGQRSNSNQPFLKIKPFAIEADARQWELKRAKLSTPRILTTSYTYLLFSHDEM